MVEINPLALINNPRFTPKIQDHSAIQKLLTDAHIQQSKNKAAAARNLQTTKASIVNKMLPENIPIAQQLATSVGAPSLAGDVIRNMLTKSRGLSDRGTLATALSGESAALKNRVEAGAPPIQLQGTPRQLAQRPGILGKPPVKESVVRTVDDSEEYYTGLRPDRLGTTKRRRKVGEKTKAAPTTGSSLSELASAGNWPALSNQITKTANYLKMSPKDLLAKIMLGIQKDDGSIIIEKHHITIDGQRIRWTR
jgi:hypothetical protein